MMLLLLILYVFSILFRQLSDGTEVGDEYFPRMTSTANSLVIYAIFFDGAGEMQHAFIENDQQHLLLAYFAFLLLATLTVMNMLIGVLCEVIFATADVEHESMTIAYVREAFEQIVDEVCTNKWYDQEDQVNYNINK